MDLWIRSQNKEILILAEHLDIYDASVEDEELFVIEESGTDLGSYKTKERALEVLDEINDIKWYKYMAELSWNDFIRIINDKTQSEKIKLFSNMNTYVMPIE